MGKLRFIEVKITVTRNEVLYSQNKPEKFIHGIVEFTGEHTHRVHYVRLPFWNNSGFGVTSINYDMAELLQLERAVL